jgi:hypothetical protein
MRISDVWRANTPEALQSAVGHIRSRFDDDLWIATSTERECHRALTAKTRSSPEPVIFQTHFNSLTKSICSLVGKTFALFMQMAVENQIDRPIDWARTQVTLMLEEELLLSEATRIRDWIVIACDGQDRPRPDPQLGRPADEAWLFNRDWQSPAWLCMKPLGNFSYDSLRAWDRDSVERSQGALEFHSNICSIHIESHLKKLAGQAHIERALKGIETERPLQQAASPTRTPSTEALSTHNEKTEENGPAGSSKRTSQHAKDAFASLQAEHNEGSQPVAPGSAPVPSPDKRDDDHPIVEVREAAPGVGLPIVDLMKPVGIIAKETKRAAGAKGAPYRHVPDLERIRKAVAYRQSKGCTYPEASLEIFGTPDWADKIRYWGNKLARGDQ